jgi:hypothetical protein
MLRGRRFMTDSSGPSLTEVTAVTADSTQCVYYLPDYGRHSICNTVPTVLDIVGASLPSTLGISERSIIRGAGANGHAAQQARTKRPLRGVYVVLVDTLSAKLMQRFEKSAGVFSDVDRVDRHTLSSVCPTITQACLPAIWCCSPPSASGYHGRFFYTARDDRTSGPILDDPMNVDMARAAELSVRPGRELQMPSWAPALRNFGITVRPFITSGFPEFTRAIYRNCDVTLGIPTRSNTEACRQIKQRNTDIAADISLIAQSLDAIGCAGTGQEIIFVHLLSIQRLASAFPAGSPDYMKAAGPLWAAIEKAIATVTSTGEWAAILTSDHGVTDSIRDNAIHLKGKALDEICRLSYAAPACNDRIAYFYPRDQSARDRIKELVADCSPPATCALIDLDWRNYERIFGKGWGSLDMLGAGQLIVLNVNKGPVYFDWDPPYKLLKRSSHGGLDRDEIEIPFLCFYPDR